MKKLLPLLLLLPLGAFAQDAVENAQPTSAAPKTMNWEIGLNNIVAFDLGSGHTFYDDVYLVGRNSVSAYRNFKAAQIGLVIEGGVSGMGDGWWLSPQAVVNYKIPFKKLYAYGGGTAGYVREQHPSWLYGPTMNGFVSGVQAGGVYSLGRHFGINLEAGVRFKHMSATVTSYPDNNPLGSPVGTTETVAYSDVYFPLSVGVRYRF